MEKNMKKRKENVKRNYESLKSGTKRQIMSHLHLCVCVCVSLTQTESVTVSFLVLQIHFHSFPDTQSENFHNIACACVYVRT